HRFKYKSVQELIDSATVPNKIYKYPVNDMTGTYQRSMISARLGVSSTSLRKSKALHKTTYFSIPELYEPTLMHFLFNDDTFGKEKLVDIDNDYFPHSSSSTEDIENESASQIESRKRIAISRLPLPQLLENVMAQYRCKREKTLKDESKIIEEQWFNTIALLELPKTLIKSTLQALQGSRKVGIIVGQISDVHSTKKVLTLRDHTGKIKAFIPRESHILYYNDVKKDVLQPRSHSNFLKAKLLRLGYEINNLLNNTMYPENGSSNVGYYIRSNN
ncbi:19907_t:CDS:2, partial [Funneliformis geosporum]